MKIYQNLLELRKQQRFGVKIAPDFSRYAKNIHNYWIFNAILYSLVSFNAIDKAIILRS